MEEFKVKSMKTKIKTTTLLLIVILASFITAEKMSAQRPYISFQVFYDQLSPYGDWVYTPDYDYIWIPNAGPDFFPYSTEGRWMLTNYGWTWTSYYDWGWAPFHYGRWDYNNYFGWYWIPGNEWSPAWVSWRRADGYYGWEPLGPHTSINMSFGRQYNYRSDHWVFVRDRDFNRSYINRYSVNRGDYDRIIRNSKVINNTYVDNRRNTTYVTGPAREDVQRATGNRINPVEIKEYNKPGHDMGDGHYSLYMPEVSKNNDNSRRSEPSGITNINDIKRPSERRADNRSDYPGGNYNNVEKVQPHNRMPAQNSGRERQQVLNQQQNSTRREQQAAPPQQGTTKQQTDNREQPQNIKQLQNSRREQQQNPVKASVPPRRDGAQKSGVSKETKERP